MLPTTPEELLDLHVMVYRVAACPLGAVTLFASFSLSLYRVPMSLI
jgi:hypothetical protein